MQATSQEAARTTGDGTLLGVDGIARTAQEAIIVPGEVVTLAPSPWDVVASNTLPAILTFVGTLLGVMLLAWVVRRVILGRLKRIAEKTTTRLDNLAFDLVDDIRVWCVFFVGLALAARVLVLPGGIAKTLSVLALGALALQLIISSRIVVDAAMARIMDRTKRADGTPDPTVLSAAGIVRVLAMTALAAAAILFALENLNVQVTPLLGALGIGGIAVALAAQNILGDLFASLMIVFDKPFQVGNFIVVGDKMGVVEKIGIKTTRIRAISGEQVVFCNSDLLSSRLHNFGMMQERRVVGTITLVYETPADKLRRVPDIIKTIIQATPNTRFDRCHFKALGSYSLDFEYVYFVTTPDFLLHALAQQAINLSIFETFAREHLEFAYPTSLQYARVTRDGAASSDLH